jgi:hypothetical protein
MDYQKIGMGILIFLLKVAGSVAISLIVLKIVNKFKK